MKRLLAAASAVVIAAAAVGWAGPPSAAGATVIDAKKATITIWHGYLGGLGSEDAAFNTVLASIRPRFPNVTFKVVRQPWFGDIYTKFEADPVHGPDLFVAPNDRIAIETAAGLLRDVTASMKSRAAGLTPQARAGAIVSKKYRMIPESSKSMALFVRPTRVTVTPATTGALLDAVKGGMKLGFLATGYDAAGFYPAFGGRIVDATYRCIADRTPGVADTFAYLRRLADAGASAYRVVDYIKLQEEFRAGRLDAVLDGSWAAADYRKALGTDVAVVPMPAGPVAAAKPFVGTDGWFVNAKRSNGALATKIALAMSDTAAQTTMMKSAGHIPANASIAVTEPISVVFKRVIATGQLMPVGPAFAAYWDPFRVAAETVVFDGADATAAVKTACSTMNATNGK